MSNTDVQRCSACGAPLDAPSQDGKIKCAYCHAINIIRPQEKKKWDSVQCPKCGTDNPREALHCRHCGSALKFSCPSCGALNPYGTTHCMRCGIDIQTEVKRREEETRLREEATRHAQEEARLREEAAQHRREEIARLEQEQARRQMEEVRKKEQRRRHTTNLIIFGVVGVVLIYVVAALGNKIYKASFSPQAQQTKTAFVAWQTSTKQAIANQTATAEYRILFQDDFSKPSSNWVVLIQDENSSARYESGEYQLRMSAPDTHFWTKTSTTFQNDVRIVVDAKQLSGTEGSFFGILCRYHDNKNFYMFIAHNNNKVMILRNLHGELTVISSEAVEWIETSSILTGSTATNHIRVDCIGNELTFYANNVKVAMATDTSLRTGGQAGLVAGTFDGEKAEILFDNFYVYRP